MRSYAAVRESSSQSDEATTLLAAMPLLAATALLPLACFDRVDCLLNFEGEGYWSLDETGKLCATRDKYEGSERFSYIYEEDSSCDESFSRKLSESVRPGSLSS